MKSSLFLRALGVSVALALLAGLPVRADSVWIKGSAGGKALERQNVKILDVKDGMLTFESGGNIAAPRPLTDAARAGFALPYQSAADRVAIARFVQDIPLSPSDPSWLELEAIEASLERLRDLPVCIVWGERDFVFTPRIRMEWERRLPAASVCAIADAGHWLLEDNPGGTEGFLRTFLDRRSV